MRWGSYPLSGVTWSSDWFSPVFQRRFGFLKWCNCTFFMSQRACFQMTPCTRLPPHLKAPLVWSHMTGNPGWSWKREKVTQRDGWDVCLPLPLLLWNDAGKRTNSTHLHLFPHLVFLWYGLWKHHHFLSSFHYLFVRWCHFPRHLRHISSNISCYAEGFVK